jgi:hypothetical protein
MNLKANGIDPDQMAYMLADMDLFALGIKAISIGVNS